VSNDARSEARLQVTTAWLLLAAQPPDAQEARRILRQALPHLRQHAGEQSVASAETELARCELLLGRPAVAQRLAQSALKRLAEESRIERAGALAVLGAAAVANGDQVEGVTRLQDAARALTDAQAPRQAAAVWRQLSDIYRRLGDSARALDAADRALDGVGVLSVPVSSETDHRAAPSRISKPKRATAKA
jgi:ATP/maltotriose-dependent transcriptional regulator MalT